MTAYEDESRVPTVIGVTTFCLSVAFISLCLRIYSRAVVIKQFGMDDWSAIVAFLFIFATGFCVVYNVNYGFGRHFSTLANEDFMSYMRTFYVSIIFYNASLLAIKITFLLQFYRVLAIPKMRKIIIVAGIIITLWGVSQVLVEIFICTPIPRFWDFSIEGSCIPNYPQWYINAGGNIITDIAVFLIPFPIVAKLKLQNGQKFILLGIFCLGFFTCAISFVRIRFLQLTEDVTWDNVEAAGWSIGELCSGLLCSCLPTMRPLLHKFFPNLTRTGRTTGGGYYYNTSSGGNTNSQSRKHSKFSSGVDGSSHGSSGQSHHHAEKVRSCGGTYSPSGSESNLKEDVYGAGPDLERQGTGSDDEFILMQGIPAPAVSVPPPATIAGRRGSAGAGVAVGSDNDLRRQATGVRTEIVSTSPPGGRGMGGLEDGAIRIERDIVQTESPTLPHHYHT